MIIFPNMRRGFDPFPQTDWTDQLEIDDPSEFNWSRLEPLQQVLPWNWDQLIFRYKGWLPEEATIKWEQLCKIARKAAERRIGGQTLASYRESTRSLEASLYSSLKATPPTPRVFISYRSLDRRIANGLRGYLLSRGKSVWMDVWDRRLWAAMSMPVPMRNILIAVIIEIALLSSTHLVVVHTKNTGSSVWVPYEIGRVKHHIPLSDNAAYWHDGHHVPEYAHLVEQFHRTREASSFAAWVSRI